MYLAVGDADLCLPGLEVDSIALRRDGWDLPGRAGSCHLLIH